MHGDTFPWNVLKLKQPILPYIHNTHKISALFSIQIPSK